MIRLPFFPPFRRGSAAAGDVGIRDSRHSDHSRRARAVREEYRRAARGEAVARPALPPGFDGAAEPPEYRRHPRNGEMTVDMNSKDKRPRLWLPSQGRAAHDSEHYYDGLLPFRRSGGSNPPAPPYPAQVPGGVPAGRGCHAQPQYLPFPHEKDVPLEEALARTPRNRSFDPPRPGATGPAPWYRRIDWAQLARALSGTLGHPYA